MAQPRIQTSVGPLVVETFGDGPPAVLMHSLFVDSGSWSRVLERLAAQRRLVLITAPGHGQSGDPGVPYTLTDIAEASLEVLDALGIKGPADWVGNALGGHVGIIFAATHPDRCRSLITFGTPVEAPSLAFRLQEAIIAPSRAVFGMSGWLGQAIVAALLSAHTRQTDPEAVNYVVACLERNEPRAFARAVRCVAIRRPNLTDALPRIGAPVLLVTGEDHPEWTPGKATAAARLLRRGSAAVVRHAAYLVPLEAPDRSAELIADHWALHP
ncbi:alpha/beta fold hydrolase [Sinomonas sp. B1-1]|uniref:alpha/beta fold hydrolase n=1 Tax=Sinomonas sp. B1-1 TaxID=3141454 RepID=UPI003D284A27